MRYATRRIWRAPLPLKGGVMIISILIGIACLVPPTPVTTRAATRATTRGTTRTAGPATRGTTRAVVTPPRRSFAEAKRVYDAAVAKAEEQFLQAQLAAKNAYLADLNLAINVAMRADNLAQANDAKKARDEVQRS